MRCNSELTHSAAEKLLEDEPNWILVRDQGEVLSILPAADLARYINDQDSKRTERLINLMEIPADRKDLDGTTLLASLQEVYELLQHTGHEAVYITGAHGIGKNKIYGILTQEMIENSYRS